MAWNSDSSMVEINCSKACLNCSKCTFWRVKPAAAACPPKWLTKCGCCSAIISMASRICTPSIDLAEPLIWIPSSSAANTILGRWNCSFKRPATIPITPWCQCSSNITNVAGKCCWSNCNFSSSTKACCFIFNSTWRRSTFKSLSCCASG